MSKTYTVEEIANLIDRLISESIIKNIYIEGELSNITYQKNGHLYFSLKDKEAIIKCAVFSYKYKNIPNNLKEGDKVKILASISYYKPSGTITFIVNSLEKKDEIGLLYQKLEELKKEYLSKGYFNESIKKPIPKLVKKLGVITAPTGAALQDIINTTHSRDENIEIIIYPVKVQGEGASLEIARAIKYFNDNQEKYNLDAIITGRGGGSIEDLWAFNEREVIEAIYASNIFIVSAVGHETDILLSDFVADLRASTPTQAVEKIIRKQSEIIDEINMYSYKLNNLLDRKYLRLKDELDNLKNSYILKNFENIISNSRLKLMEFETNITKIIKNKYETVKNNYMDLKSRLIFSKIVDKNQNAKVNLDTLNNILKDKFLKVFIKNKTELEKLELKVLKHSNEDILKKGYTITTYKGKILKRSIDVSRGETIKTQFIDGYIESDVI